MPINPKKCNCDVGQQLHKVEIGAIRSYDNLMISWSDWNRNNLGGGLYWPNICICICICVHYLILRSHDEITRAGAKELVRMSHRGCCRGGPTAHPLVDLLPLLHPFFGHITTFPTFWLLPLLHLFWTYCQADLRFVKKFARPKISG